MARGLALGRAGRAKFLSFGASRDKTGSPTMTATIPAAHALVLGEVTERLGLPQQALFERAGLDPEALGQPGARLPLAAAEALIGTARQLTREPGLGVYLGLQMRVSSHGYVGFAAMTASDIGSALEVACRFAPTQTDALALSLEVCGGEASLYLDERAALGTARDVIVLALMIGLRQIGEALTGQSLAGEADVAFEAPDYYDRFAPFARGTVRFAQPRHRLRFDARLLRVPLMLRDPVAQRMATEQCERELELLAQGELIHRARSGLTRGGSGGYRTIEELARHLGLSSRTLKRRLAERGTSFSTLLDERRCADALRWLADPELSLEQIAGRLGYSEAANFTRAFRRWTGQSPRARRRANRRA